MKKRRQFKEQPEPGGGTKQKLKTKLAGWALLGTFLLGKVGEGMAQEVKTEERKQDGKEIVMQQDSTSKEVAKTLDRFDVDSGGGPGIEPDPDPKVKPTPIPEPIPEEDPEPDEELGPDDEGGEDGEGETGSDEEKSNGEGGVKVHGMLYGGTGVAGDYAEVCSDRGTLIAVVDVSESKTGLGFTAIRLDDFHSDPEQPASRATVLNPHWNKKFGRLGIGIEGKYTFIDHLPQANGFSPDVVLSYTADGGRTFEGMYAHRFKTGEDSDVFRLTMSKKVGEALTLTGQGWYETGYDGHFYGRVIVDVDLGNGFGAQLSCIAKYGKLTPTAGVIYRF